MLKALLESELLRQFLDTTEGRLILNNVVDKIRDKTMYLVSMCSTNYERNLGQIKQLALEIKIAKDFMYELASLAIKGETHKEAMKGRKKQ